MLAHRAESYKRSTNVSKGKSSRRQAYLNTRSSIRSSQTQVQRALSKESADNTRELLSSVQLALDAADAAAAPVPMAQHVLDVDVAIISARVSGSCEWYMHVLRILTRWHQWWMVLKDEAECPMRDALLRAANPMLSQVLSHLTVQPDCLYAAMYVLACIIPHVEVIDMVSVLPALVRILYGVEIDVDERCTTQAAWTLSVILTNASSFMDDDEITGYSDAIDALIHATRYRILSPELRTVAMRAIGDIACVVSDVRVVVLIPVLFEAVQGCDGYSTEVVRVQAMKSLSSLAPVSNDLCNLLRSCGILSFCISQLQYMGVHVDLAMAMLQFIEMFTNDNVTTLQWAIDDGLLDALGTVCGCSTLPSGLHTEALWILVDLAFGTATMRQSILNDLRLCTFPFRVLLSREKEFPPDAVTASYAFLNAMMEDADGKLVNQLIRLGAMEVTMRSVGSATTSIVNVGLDLLEAMVDVYPESGNEFLVRDGAKLLAALSVSSSSTIGVRSRTILDSLTAL